MNCDIADKFLALSAADRRRTEIAAASLLMIDAHVAPRGKGAVILMEAMRIAAEVKSTAGTKPITE